MSNLTELLAADAALSAGDRELCARQIGEALTRVQTNRWEVEEAARALTASNPALCRRYLSKALERVRCMYCHGELDDERRYRPHFEGFVHLDCAERYDGRGDYLRQHPDERDR